MLLTTVAAGRHCVCAAGDLASSGWPTAFGALSEAAQLRFVGLAEEYAGRRRSLGDRIGATHGAYTTPTQRPPTRPLNALSPSSYLKRASNGV